MYYPKRFVMLNACPPKLKIQNRKLHPRHYGSAPDVVHQLQHARRVSIKSWAGTVPILLNRSIVVTHTACREWMRCHPVHSDTLCLLLLTILFELSIPVLVVLVNLLRDEILDTYSYAVETWFPCISRSTKEEVGPPYPPKRFSFWGSNSPMHSKDLPFYACQHASCAFS